MSSYRTLEIIEEECGCIKEMIEHDVDRPFMCYIERYTDYINKCDKHTQEEKEREEFYKLERIREEDERIRKEDERKQYILEVVNIIHTSLIPLKIAAEKYRSQLWGGNGLQWFHKRLISNYKEILLIQKLSNKWMCSKEKLDFINFKQLKLCIL